MEIAFANKKLLRSKYSISTRKKSPNTSKFKIRYNNKKIFFFNSQNVAVAGIIHWNISKDNAEKMNYHKWKIKIKMEFEMLWFSRDATSTRTIAFFWRIGTQIYTGWVNGPYRYFKNIFHLFQRCIVFSYLTGCRETLMIPLSSKYLNIILQLTVPNSILNIFSWPSINSHHFCSSTWVNFRLYRQR